MKNNIFLSLILIFVTFSTHAQTRISSSVTDATIYLNGAALTHTADATLKSGSQEILIDGLSPFIEINSLKINANGVLISATEFSYDFITTREESARITRIKDSLEQYKQLLTQATDEQTVYTHLLKMLTDGTLNNMQAKENQVSVADINANMELYKSKAGTLQKNIDQLKRKVAELQKIVNRLQSQVAHDELKEKQTTGLLRLSVSVPKAITTTFTITYFTDAASWTPCYDLNIKDMDAKVVLHSKAQVQQSTGLDWQIVHLTLSNATPNRTTVATVFSPWFVNFLKNISYRANKSDMLSNTITYETAGVASTEGYLTEVRGSRATTPLKMDDYVEVDQQEVHVNYVIAVHYDIPGNGKTQLIDLKEYTITAEYKYYSAPKLSDETYLVATLSDYQKHNLLPGYVTVTFNNTFVGKSLLQPNNTDSLFTLTLATDPRIAVKREKRMDFCSTKHVGNSTTVTQSYLITVKNNQTKDVKFTLKDQYPISADKDIEVKLIEHTPAATYNKTDRGILTWDMDLKAGETRTFTVTYSIKYPKDRNINL
ncbi:MAG: mucoidy inhibitor MuiA family protein [Bacteroidales bacterium]|nr:mucoidy inhibitor MuiA family protein [Bacteroidales bacterium]